MSMSPSSSRAGASGPGVTAFFLGRILPGGGFTHPDQRFCATAFGEIEPGLRSQALDAHLLAPVRILARGEPLFDRGERVDGLARPRSLLQRAAPSARAKYVIASVCGKSLASRVSDAPRPSAALQSEARRDGGDGEEGRGGGAAPRTTFGSYRAASAGLSRTRARPSSRRI
jgi:hypothetical protein